MGADMVSAAIALPRGKRPDFEAGQKVLDNLKIDMAMIHDLENDGYCEAADWLIDDDVEGDRIEHFDVEEIRKFMKSVLEDVNLEMYGRSSATYYIRDLEVYFVGEMSWGDIPDCCYAFWRLYALPAKVGEACGFVLNFEEPAGKPLNPVTPEEEQEVIERIKTSA